MLVQFSISDSYLNCKGAKQESTHARTNIHTLQLIGLLSRPKMKSVQHRKYESLFVQITHL